MKRVTILLVTVWTICSCEEPDIEPTLNKYRLSRILHYSSSTSGKPYGLVELDYDDRGNLVKESMFDWPDILTAYKVYEYTNGRKTKEKIFGGQVGDLTLTGYINYYYTNDNVTKEEWYLGTLNWRTYYEFDGDNLINTYKEDDNLGIHHQYKYSYDSKGRLILEEMFMYNQELDGFTRYYYDNTDRPTKTELYDRHGLVSYAEKVYYGSDELPDELLSYDAGGQLTGRSELIYDRWGNAVGCKSTWPRPCLFFSRRYRGQLLIEAITYHPYFDCTEWTVTRYEYEAK